MQCWWYFLLLLFTTKWHFSAEVAPWFFYWSSNEISILRTFNIGKGGYGFTVNPFPSVIYAKERLRHHFFQQQHKVAKDAEYKNEKSLHVISMSIDFTQTFIAMLRVCFLINLHFITSSVKLVLWGTKNLKMKPCAWFYPFWRLLAYFMACENPQIFYEDSANFT